MVTMRIVALLLLVRLGYSQEESSQIQTRAIDGSQSASQGASEKFKIYVGTIDGVRRELFNEVDGGEDVVPSGDVGAIVDPFGAYDDNLIISTENEKNLFVPKPYRPGGEKKTTSKPTTTTPRPTLAPSTTRQPAPVTARPSTLPPVVVSQTQAPQQFRPVQPVQSRPVPTAPPRIIPQTVAPFTQAPFTRGGFSQSPFTRPFVPVTQRPFIPQPQQTIQPQAPFQQPFRPQQPFTRPAPFRPPVQPTTPAPRLPFAGTGNLRTGVCPASIFYISTPISGPTRLTFTHFAIAVTVDQCARTCHEFNCAIAHYNPTSGHCEFNPSTAFAIRNGQCPAWPSLHYRNNVVASQSVRIFCVQCQRPRRRPNRQRVVGRHRVFDPRQQTRSFFRRPSRGSSSSFSHHVIHGSLVKQPQAVALGTVQEQFVQAIQAPEGEINSFNTGDAPLSKARAAGTTQYSPESSKQDQLEVERELELFQQ